MARSEAPVMCTLSRDGIVDRMAEFQALFAEALTGVAREPLVLRLTFDASREPTIRALMAREQQCCAFLGFTFTRTESGLVVGITAPDGAGSTLDPFQAAAEGEMTLRAVPESPHK